MCPVRSLANLAVSGPQPLQSLQAVSVGGGCSVWETNMVDMVNLATRGESSDEGN